MMTHTHVKKMGADTNVTGVSTASVIYQFLFCDICLTEQSCQGKEERRDIYIQLKSEVYLHLSQIHLNSVFHNILVALDRKIF